MMVAKQLLLWKTAVELGDGAVRTIAMESTDGLQRGMKVVDLGRTISVPVGT